MISLGSDLMYDKRELLLSEYRPKKEIRILNSKPYYDTHDEVETGLVTPIDFYITFSVDWRDYDLYTKS